MDTRVRLQEMFSFSKIPIYVVLGAIVFVLVCIIACILIKKLKDVKRKPKIKKPVVVDQRPVNAEKVKQRYLNMLFETEQAYLLGECSVRKAFQRMSVIIRGFVGELTGIKVQNCTLQDIKVLHMPVLEELIEEYYSPEFEQKSEGDVLTSLQKTREAIMRWN